MVFYFTSNIVDPPVTLFMGEDKHENEALIKWGWPEDVWWVEEQSVFRLSNNDQFQFGNLIYKL